MDPVVPYADEGTAQSYFDDARLNAEAWYHSSSINRLKALKSATTMINRLNFKGSRAATAQVNEFPRISGRQVGGTIVVSDAAVPTDIIIACCEIALNLLDGVDPDLEEDALGDITDAYATARVTSDPAIRKDHIRAGIPSVVAWKRLLPYLNDPMELHIMRG
jgi:hypothetical protein